jgi:hypothetical protein
LKSVLYESSGRGIGRKNGLASVTRKPAERIQSIRNRCADVAETNPSFKKESDGGLVRRIEDRGSCTALFSSGYSQGERGKLIGADALEREWRIRDRIEWF